MLLGAPLLLAAPNNMTAGHNQPTKRRLRSE
jgi:hypothetical protein